MPFKLLVLLVFLLQLATPAAVADPRLELPASVVQGALVTGRVPPGSSVHLGERPLRVAPDGWFVFGVGRDHGTGIELHARFPDGSRHLAQVAVEQRAWRIERVDGLPPATVSPDPALARRIASEQARVSAARERDDDRTDFLQAFAWPVQGRVSGVYGSQRILNGEPRNPHYGLDVAAPTGTPIRAPAAGLVILAEPDFYLTGGTLTLDHGHGVSSTFIHLSRIDRAVGERVEQGEVIGAVGATGRATGPHMHWGMNWFEVRVDPQLLLPSP
ncbi:MAG: M23 family metallopeptidase [Pseudoxanthomonas sp.]|mgnify:CR=1 FL=1|nr:M23 family metallopeptidase [Pseudoxanthomonas sp.]